MKEFLEKNPLPKFDTDEFDKRWQEKKEERKKYSGHTTAYQEMEAASTPPKETPDGKDPTEELEERLRTGNFEFPELPEYNEEFEQIKHYAEKVIQSNSSSNSQMKDSPTNDTAEREHVEKMLDELMSREPPKNPYKNKPEENEGNKQEPWRQTPKQPLEEKRQMNPYEGSMDPEYNLLSDEKVLEILQSDGFQEFVKQQTGQSREEIKDELTTIGEVCKFWNQPNFMKRVKIARTLQGKGGFSEYLHESYDPSKPEKFDYVTEKFEEHMDGSLGDIGNALPEERDKLFGKDTEKVIPFCLLSWFLQGQVAP